ncbi:MAG: EamA family transporter [Kineosporiaceae bacterium]
MSRRGWVLFLALSLIWGIPYLLIKIAVGDLSPAMVVFGRTALAAVILLPVAAARGVLPALRTVWRWVLVFAVAEIAVPFVMLGSAERRLTSSLTALLIAAIPLVALVLSRLAGLEHHLEPRRLAGLLVGLAGVGALAGLDLRSGDLLPVGAVACAVLGYAMGPIIVTRWLSEVSGLGVSAVALTVNAVVYAPFAWLTRPRPAAVVSDSAWVAVAVLGVVCSALAFLVFFALVAEVGPARTTVITYVNPVVAAVAGIVVLDEPITRGLLVGFPLVLLGSWLATRRSPAREVSPVT